MILILWLTLKGSLAFGVVWMLDRVLASRMQTTVRRWWWLAVAFSFLAFFSLPIVPHGVAVPSLATPEKVTKLLPFEFDSYRTATDSGAVHFSILFWLYLAGAGSYLSVVMLQTRRARQRWSSERFSTDTALLNALEDCKQEAGITAPIGLVVSDAMAAPAIMGWLRPRILLPSALASTMTRTELRAVLFHELAHFRSLDIPVNWLFTLVCAVHWFNPFSHLAFRSWAQFREEAADEKAMTWMKAASPSYGETLLHALREANGTTAPFGALAIGESIHNLKRRITMINHYSTKSPRFLTGGLILLLLVAGFIARPVQAEDADPKAAATAAMETWLHEMDDGEYAKSWSDASVSFQKVLTSEQWVRASQSVRAQLGKCNSRKLLSALHQTEVPSPTGPIKGDFVIAQYDSSFANLAYAVETVCFEKEADGTWKASGYYIKPKT